MFYQISRTFAFAGVKHDELTPFLRWAPITSSVILLIAYAALPVRPILTGDGSLSRHMITVFAILPGFYIAALAAVATFNREEMDFVMPDPAPKMRLRTGNDVSWIALTFRMFLSHLFAYLVAISFLAVFVFVAADLSAKSIDVVIANFARPDWVHGIRLMTKLLYVMVVGWLAARIVLTTLFGLYFLAERIHRPSA